MQQGVNIQSFLSDIDLQIIAFQKKSKHNENIYKKLSHLSWVFIAIFPSLVIFLDMPLLDELSNGNTKEAFSFKSFQFDFRVFLQGLLIIYGLIVAFVKAFLNSQNYYVKWKNYKAVAMQLEVEKLKFKSGIEPYDQSDSTKKLEKAVEGILNDSDI